MNSPLHFHCDYLVFASFSPLRTPFMNDPPGRWRKHPRLAAFAHWSSRIGHSAGHCGYDTPAHGNANSYGYGCSSTSLFQSSGNHRRHRSPIQASAPVTVITSNRTDASASRCAASTTMFFATMDNTSRFQLVFLLRSALPSDGVGLIIAFEQVFRQHFS